MMDPTSADAYYADWNGRTVIRDVAPPVPEVTVLTPVTLTDEEREAIWQSINFYDDEADDLYPAVERIIAARPLEQATR